MHEENKKSFLEELRELDPSAKKKVLIGTTALVMALVIYIWLGYFNNIIASGPVQAVAMNGTSSISSSSSSDEPGFFERVVGGGAYMFGEMGGWAGQLKKAIEGPRQYIIKP